MNTFYTELGVKAPATLESGLEEVLSEVWQLAHNLLTGQGEDH